MGKVSVEGVLEQLRQLSKDQFCGVDIRPGLVLSLELLLGYLEGCDPAETLPEYDVPVWIQWEWEGTRCQTIATRTVYEGVEIWLPTNTGCNYVPVELVFRWHPLPGGE